MQMFDEVSHQKRSLPVHCSIESHTIMQPVSSTSQASVGPHWAHELPCLALGGQAIGQLISVHASTLPSLHVHWLQLNGSGTGLPWG